MVEADTAPDSVAGERASGDIIVVGANHRSSAADLRDRIFVPDPDVPAFLSDLLRDGIAQCMVMSTCDRVEVQAFASAAAVPLVQRALAQRCVKPDVDLGDQIYALTGRAAVRHIFAVAASLDSMVIGEPQVLGQVKESHRQASQAGTMGAELDAVLQAAYGAAKRVRSETAIARGPVSLAACAVQVARDVHGDLARRSGLLVGAGDMGGLMLEHMRQAGLHHVVVSAATMERAAAIARPYGCTAIPFEALPGALEAADVVIAAANLGRYLISVDMVRTALVKRRRRPIFLIDAALPGDVERAVHDLDEAFRYDLDDLEALAQEGRLAREAVTGAAWQLVDEAVSAYEQARSARGAVPTLVRLRRHFEAARAEVLAGHPGLDAEAATRLLLNRLLHAPSQALRELAGSNADGNEALQRLAARLFALDDAGCDDLEEEK